MFNITNTQIHHWTCSTASPFHFKSHNWFPWPHNATQACKRSNNFIFLLPHLHSRYMPCPSQPHRFHSLTNTRWPVKTVEALVMWYPKLFAYLCVNILWAFCFRTLVTYERDHICELVKQISNCTPVFYLSTQMEPQLEGMCSIPAFFPELASS
jgi:hypothetical protein